MKHLILAVLLAFAGTATAQTVDTTAESGSASQARTDTRVGIDFGDTTIQPGSQTIKSAPGHGLAAATNSFSSDYCGGTAQIGGSWLTGSLGLQKQTFDPNCQALRRADKFGQQSAQVASYNQPQRRDALMAMSIWETCMSNPNTLKACKSMGLVDKDATL
ncbi:MAG TPA: hypothetical protein VGD46_19515 [Rhizobacter sp.]